MRFIVLCIRYPLLLNEPVAPVGGPDLMFTRTLMAAVIAAM